MRPDTRKRLLKNGVQQLPSPEKLKMLRGRLENARRPKDMSEEEFQEKIRWIKTDLETLDPAWPLSEELDWNKELDVMSGELSEMKYNAATRLAFNQQILFQENQQGQDKVSTQFKSMTKRSLILMLFLSFDAVLMYYLNQFFDQLLTMSWLLFIPTLLVFLGIWAGLMFGYAWAMAWIVEDGKRTIKVFAWLLRIYFWVTTLALCAWILTSFPLGITMVIWMLVAISRIKWANFAAFGELDSD